MKKRTMIIVLVIALILVSAGIFIAVKGFLPYTEPSAVEDDAPIVAEKPENLSPEEEIDKSDLEEEKVQSNPGEENLELEEEGKEESSKESQTQEKPLSLKQKYELILESGKPSIIVFSYDAECCESTRIFFENYNKKSFEIINANKEKFDTLFINTGILEKQDMETTLEIAKKKGVVNLPSILILDHKGDAYKVFTGPFEKEDVEVVLEEVIDA